jgi:hypothetical protein
MSAESRKHPRAPLLATAVLHEGPRAIGTFRVINASAGGLLLAGEAPAELARVEVLLRLPGDRIVRGQAAIVRRETQKGRPAFALAFSGVSSVQEGLIQHAVAAALEEARTAGVVILEDDLDVTQALRDGLARFGWRSFPVTSFLELAHALERPNNFCIAFVAHRFSGRAGGWADGPEVLGYLATQCPEIRRVLMVDEGDLAEFQQRGSCPEDLTHEILPKPWTDSRLGDALGGCPTVKVPLIPED